MSPFTLDWAAIRPLNGGREKGFEELCSQLARAEARGCARFVRKGTPDAGVECYAVFSDGTEWGWQSKYFATLGDSQWKQIDESVKTAIEKHPKITRYYVAVPLDLADARIIAKKGSKRWQSAKDRWDAQITEWRASAQKNGRAIEFVWWGSSEILERMARSENFGRARFWFDKSCFDGQWFSARLDEAIKTAGPRYTPELHFALPIAEDLEAFGRTQRFFNNVKSLAIPVREALRRASYSQHSIADDESRAMTDRVSDAVQGILNALGAISQVPAGPLPFQRIIEMVEVARAPTRELAAHYERLAQEHDAKLPTDKTGRARDHTNPFRQQSFRLDHLEFELEKTSEALYQADELAAGRTLVLSGKAGTGKTHLLCDVAKRRIEVNQPTILIMGQRFVSNDAPWAQVLQQLDLPGLSAEEFIGALEAAAQASGERALILVDAINEGTGRNVWPHHLAAFLAHADRSPWIGVVLSVRSSYEEVIIPAEVRDTALLVTHHGFREHEYDATKAFFLHYGLELPSTPLLAPEFQNPLFLKTLCEGIRGQGQFRLPRGFHGISRVFNLYLETVNDRLAERLGYDRRRPLVLQAMDKIAVELIATGDRWLERERVADVVDALLPGREFDRSLFRGLVVEGILVEDSLRRAGSTAHDVVFVAFERFADHVIAKALLDKVGPPHDWAAAFSSDGILSAAVSEAYIPSGLLEALFVQVAERAGAELLTFAPQLAPRCGTGDAFRQSLIWRDNAAFSTATLEALDDFCRSEADLHETLEVLLTVATIPGHPLNALFLDRWLRKYSMADRDAWWSTYLYEGWGSHGAVNRLVDWAWAIESTAAIPDDAIDLCGIVLAWMLTTSHRFLRDRATKALVNLYSQRLPELSRLVDRFGDVDDPYVRERIYAVAYGVAMRCHDAASVGGLAAAVYRCVFEAGSPPAHILLRDYARGVVERALHLGSTISVNRALIRPPYKSEWPPIPSEEEVEPLLPDWSDGSRGIGEHQWSQNAIGFSVMGFGDFARYILGMNSSTGSREYLSIRLSEPQWMPPPTAAEQLAAFLDDLSHREFVAWEAFDVADRAFKSADSEFWREWLASGEEGERRSVLDVVNFRAGKAEGAPSYPPELVRLDAAKREAERALCEKLSAEHVVRWRLIKAVMQDPYAFSRPPRFEMRQVQRYIFKRVFDLGWTLDRFGRFDTSRVRVDGRSSNKPERIGKKYQWIAYHEILALLSDHFQYREEYRSEGDQSYQGPWQSYVRDIDPSCTLRTVPVRAPREGLPKSAWWEAGGYAAWPDEASRRSWISSVDDLPSVEDLLIPVNPTDGSRWVNGCGYFTWIEEAPRDQRPTDVARGNLWYSITAYLIREVDKDAFLSWAETTELPGAGMPGTPQVSQMFLGEHGWSPASSYFQDAYHGDAGWVQPEKGCPVRLRQVAVEYLKESSGYDCSVDEGYTLRLPVEELLTKLNIRWTGRDADFATPSGRLIAMDPTAKAPGPAALLLLVDALLELQRREELTLCWFVRGEKRILDADFAAPVYPSLELLGVYVLESASLKGFVRRRLIDHETGVLTVIDADNCVG